MKRQVTRKQKGNCRLGSILFSSSEIWSFTFAYLAFWVFLKKESMVVSISFVERTWWRFWKKSEISRPIILRCKKGTEKRRRMKWRVFFGQKNFNCFFFFCLETSIVIKVCFWRVKIYEKNVGKKDLYCVSFFWWVSIKSFDC